MRKTRVLTTNCPVMTNEPAQNGYLLDSKLLKNKNYQKILLKKALLEKQELLNNRKIIAELRNYW